MLTCALGVPNKPEVDSIMHVVELFMSVVKVKVRTISGDWGAWNNGICINVLALIPVPL